MSERVAVGVGSNLGAREEHVRTGLEALGGLLRDLRVSSVYETRPVGDSRQPDFLNLCCVGVAYASARELLESLLRVELEAGRRRGPRRFGPRTLDLDLLLYGDLMLDEPGLRVPHPRLVERAFVLLPLAELAPEWRHPELGRTVAELASEADASGVRRAGPPPTPDWKGDRPGGAR